MVKTNAERQAERGKRNVSVSVINRIAGALGLRTSELFAKAEQLAEN